MLLEFALSNYRSIRGEQRLNPVAGPERNLRDANTFQPARTGGVAAKNNPRLLRSVAVYGPNASGKTNLIRALAMMKPIVLESHRQTGPRPVEPFAFDSATRVQPTQSTAAYCVTVAELRPAALRWGRHH
uniref:AAA domain n=1 Tax=Candidatus Kentrum eta TaxID=2126337 RepID=A0A450UEP4_9GAMM|nr:MAG: AAA domain [Candidatus Kentron sp. H]VFJ90932.1 MAG: AAA domain [Candidatus Kentron sp. H]VFJ97950.1 MAG: AAA domain [Candidatus Kentron sp. H]